MPSTAVKNKMNKIKGLTQYRNLDKDKLQEVAEKMLEKQDKKEKDILDVSSLFEDKQEKKEAERLLNKYMSNFSITTISDKNILTMLIFLEIMQNRFMKDANAEHKKTGSTPNSITESIHKNIKEILSLKNQLGILKAKTADGAAEAIDILINKYKIWCEENQACREFVCPDCGQMTLLKIKIDQYDASLHPFFQDRILFNEEIVKLFLEGKITALNVARILDCSVFYIDWVINKLWPTNPRYNAMKEKIEKNREVSEITEVKESIDEATT